MRKEEVQEIVDILTSFYREYLPVNSKLEELIGAYIEAFEMAWQETYYLQSHLAVEDAPTLYTIPFFQLDVTEGLYDKSVAQLLVGKPFGEILDYLVQERLYVQLHFTAEANRKPLVYDMQLKKDFHKDETLVYFEDYFLRDNRVYFLPNFILKNTNYLKYLYAIDIRVDNFLMEDRWGSFFDIEAGPLLPRFQYRDVLSAFLRLMSSKLTIRDIRDAVRLATKWDDFDIQDMKSPNISPERLAMYESKLISPAQFMITLGERLIKDKMLMNIVLSMLDEAKEVQTSYIIFYLLLRTDLLLMGDGDSKKWTFRFPKGEILYPKSEEQVRFMYYVQAEDVFHQPYRYDVGRHVDFRLSYDYEQPDVTEPFGMDMPEAIADKGLSMDEPWQFRGEYVEIRPVTFPKIPRGVVATKTGTTVRFTFDENADGTTAYELHGRPDTSSDFTLLATETVNTNATNEIVHDASTSGMRYYKLRAIFYHESSLFTLEIDSNTL